MSTSRALQWALMSIAIGLWAGFGLLTLGALRTLFVACWRYAVSKGQCIGCLKRRCPMVGSVWTGRRREHAYCPECMPELYR